MTSTQDPQPRLRTGIWKTAAYFGAVAAVVAAVYLIFPETPSSPEASPQTESTTTTLAPLPVEDPADVPSEEPIADAAEVILPSVVHIQTSDGVGSGVIYEANGLILTAAHVVQGEETVTVRFNDGERLTGVVLGADPNLDIAVVSVDRTGLPPATLALDSKPRVGQLAIAVGSPWGLESTVTAGIISAVDQADCSFDGAYCVSMLQTDAAINPGNSGGALVDRQGRVVGINVSIFSASGANEGVGFAVPIDVAFQTAASITAGEELQVAFLGVSGGDPELGQAGAVITEVFEGSAADQAGVLVEDLVIRLDGVRIEGIADLSAQVRVHRPGDVVDLVIVRDGEEITLQVTLGVRPDDLS